MPLLLFKYLSPGGALKSLSDESGMQLRFGLPKTYNDPYELFLHPDPPCKTEGERAFYDFFLGTVAQAPVTCFSKRPDSVVMWAHYAHDGRGVCVGFDEDTLTNQFELAFIDDVTYRDAPASIDSGVVKFAFTTGKRRHTFRVLEIGHRAAYFMKRSDWQYEYERRMVVPPDAVVERENMLVAQIAPAAIRCLILGANVDSNVRPLVEARASQYGVPSFQLHVGRRTYQPFFRGSDGATTLWNGTVLESAVRVCASCGEPASELEDELCEWCGISKGARDSAPRRSMLTATLHYGIDKGIPLAFDGIEPKGRWVEEERRKRASQPKQTPPASDLPFEQSPAEAAVPDTHHGA